MIETGELLRHCISFANAITVVVAVSVAIYYQEKDEKKARIAEFVWLLTVVVGILLTITR